MRLHVPLVVIVAGLLVSAMPAAAQAGINNPEQSTSTTLYMHLNGFQDFPINTQVPSDSYAASEGIGLQMHSTSCLPYGGAGSLASKSWHTFYGFASPGYVEYDFEENGKPRFHPERGISFDAIIDTNAPFTLYWFLETQTGAPGGSPDPNSVPVVLPNVVVRATMRTGDPTSVDDIGYNAGEVIAQGQTEPSTLATQGTQGPAVYHQASNGRHVYEFAVPMTIQQPTVPRATGYNLRIDVFMDNPFCTDPDDGYLMPNSVRVHTSPDYRPRMELAVMNPIRIEYLVPQFVGDDLVVHTAANSPWGNYDVDETPGGIEIAIEGPSEATSLAQVAFTQRHHEHNFHQEAVDVSYVWPYKQDGARNGLYTVSWSVWNDHRTAQATGTAQFEIGTHTTIGCGRADRDSIFNTDCYADPPAVGVESSKVNTSGGIEMVSSGVEKSKESPGAGPLGALAVVGAALVVLRRRCA